MKITHTTYDATHRRQSMARRASDASVRIKNYISSHLSRRLDTDSSHQDAGERPTTFWPRYETETSVPDDQSEMTPYLTQQHRVKKAARRDEKIIVNANHNSNYLPLKDTDRGAAADDARPTLRRKTKFVREKPSTNSTDCRPHTADGKENMHKLQKLRQAMREGKIEQAVPPNQRIRIDDRFAETTSRISAEPSRGRSSSRDRPPQAFYNSRGRKARSISRVGHYVRASVDLLDETRKEVQSKFKAPFENLNYPSFMSRRASSDSEESFFCRGEKTEEQNPTTLNSRQYDPEEGRRLSGAGVSPWTSHKPDYCKICKTFAMVGIQGLCDKCEANFNRRKAQNRDSDSEYEDDIRPTPPLKDAKTLAMRQQPQAQHYFQVETDSLEDVTDMGSRPIFNPVPLEVEKSKTQKRVEQWSAKYENDVAYAEERDTAPLVSRKKMVHQRGGSRDTKFYNFYDDVLDNR